MKRKFGEQEHLVYMLQPNRAMYHDSLVAFGSRRVNELRVYVYLDHVYIGTTTDERFIVTSRFPKTHRRIFKCAKDVIRQLYRSIWL